ncbi:3-ketosteroid 9alpha-monooxygenase subunit B [Halopolyspora algeriensis]|uniref:3-ketosteroid 9alpha-monooxygenase subunit B n=1 Tax=Halopolyspora algeriensis TaxID=1500506 RepID=A0A368VSA4_9ACTN|nr:ferredoxin--NADP reductase [Halopolyspora algeriensis]RCW44565.1 3-ketosteroid 9alpha-monooxygenase subunit B [Halopolyspora algeriensis]TQM55925.1 3-ketosteroid 9alpha-monooxygenase subunit B [Halopolyspora algeriensis]
MSEPRLPATDSIRLEVAEVIDETADARSLVFTVPEGPGGPMSYRPGQFLTLRVPGDSAGPVGRCYSLSSSPHTDAAPKVTVKRVDGGYGSNWLCDNVVPGTTVELLPPAGVFTPASLDEDLLLFAGGSGITPVISIVKSALAEGGGRIVLIYANRDQDSVIFAAELRALAEQYPQRLTVIHWLETVQGLPGAAALRALAEPFSGFDVFVCGPNAFMEVANRALRDMEVPRNRIHIERFLSLEDNPFDPGDAATEPTGEEAAPEDGEAVVEVDLDGARSRFAWPRGKLLLDLLLERGLDAPYSCRQGACSACACRIDSGEVKMQRNQILEQEDLDEGIVLACQSLPVTDEVHISYE